MIDILKPLIKRFMPFAKEKMGFSRPPKLFLRQDEQNAADPMGKTGFYDPEKESITLYITGRHPKDIMRSLAHELQHHTQKCNGDFENVQNMGEEGYAQTNPHMRTMEIEAYQASIVFRDWEDSCKGTTYYEHLQKGDKSSMSTKNWKNQELNGLLMERFGFEFKPLIENLEEYATKSKGKGKEEKSKFQTDQQKCASKNPPEAPGTPIPEHERDWYWDDQDQQCRQRAKVAKSKDKKDKEEKLDEMCPAMTPDEAEEGIMVIGDRGGDDPGAEGPEEGGEEDLQALAGDLLSVSQRIADALGGSMSGEEEEEELEERRGRGRKGPHIRGPEDPRLRENIAKLRKAGYSTEQIKEFLINAYSRVLKG